MTPPALRTFQEGIAAALTPGQRAGLRAGERARREYDAYLRWEPEARNEPVGGRPLLRQGLIERKRGEYLVSANVAFSLALDD